jgi:hypothetical protein
VFAQPKPGNWQFAMDFAQIAGSHGMAFVINNDLDWVPQLPLSLEFFDEPGGALLAAINSEPGLRGVINSGLATAAIGFTQGARAMIALQVNKDTIKSIEYGNRFEDQYLEPGYAAAQGAVSAYSVNYMLAGAQVPVFGSASPNILLTAQALRSITGQLIECCSSRRRHAAVRHQTSSSRMRLIRECDVSLLITQRAGLRR